MPTGRNLSGGLKDHLSARGSYSVFILMFVINRRYTNNWLVSFLAFILLLLLPKWKTITFGFFVHWIWTVRFLVCFAKLTMYRKKWRTCTESCTFFKKKTVYVMYRFCKQPCFFLDFFFDPNNTWFNMLTRTLLTWFPTYVYWRRGSNLVIWGQHCQIAVPANHWNLGWKMGSVEDINIYLLIFGYK